MGVNGLESSHIRNSILEITVSLAFSCCQHYKFVYWREVVKKKDIVLKYDLMSDNRSYFLKSSDLNSQKSSYRITYINVAGKRCHLVQHPA